MPTFPRTPLAQEVSRSATSFFPRKLRTASRRLRKPHMLTTCAASTTQSKISSQQTTAPSIRRYHIGTKTKGSPDTQTQPTPPPTRRPTRGHRQLEATGQTPHQGSNERKSSCAKDSSSQTATLMAPPNRTRRSSAGASAAEATSSTCVSLRSAK